MPMEVCRNVRVKNQLTNCCWAAQKGQEAARRRPGIALKPSIFNLLAVSSRMNEYSCISCWEHILAFGVKKLDERVHISRGFSSLQTRSLRNCVFIASVNGVAKA